MITHSVGLAAGFALAANAFLIPSTTSLKQPNAFANSVEQLTQPPTRLVKLDCPGCSVPEGLEIEGASSLVLNFTLVDDNKALLLNGGHLYPGLPSASLPVTQTASDTTFEALQKDASEVSSEERYLSFGSIVKSIVAADGTDAELVDINFHIIALGNENVNVDNLDIRLLKSEDGTLGIGDIVQVAAPHTPNMDNGEALFEIKPIDNIQGGVPGCPAGMPGVFCRLRDMMAARLEVLREKAHNRLQLFNKHRKPCPGMLKKIALKGGVDKFIGQQKEAAPKEDAPENHHHHHHGAHHQMHHHMHHVMIALRRVIFGFVLPVMIGIAAGMTASLVGMIVGTAIAYLWIKFVRKGKKGRAGLRIGLAEEEQLVSQEVDEEDVPEEKQGLMAGAEGVDAPPQYAEKE